MCNVSHRLINKGLLPSLERCGVEYALQEMGASGLANDKKPLSEMNVEEYRMVVDAL